MKIKLLGIGLFALLATCQFSSCNLNSKKAAKLIQKVAEQIDTPPEAINDDIEGEALAVNQDGLLQQVLPQGTSEQLLYRKGYTSSYNKELLQPNYVAWHLTAAHLKGKAKRNGYKFTADNDVPAPRADTYDYIQSGFDRGHMCPAGDNKWDDKAMEQSFLMTNICPQHPNLNRGDWNEIEEACRQWAKKYGSVYVVCGPIFLNQKHKRIGEHKVVVPEAFFKVVLCLEGKPKAIGFICRNTAGNRKKDAYVNSVDEVERITGIDFFSTLPDDVEKTVEAKADLSEW